MKTRYKVYILFFLAIALTILFSSCDRGAKSYESEGTTSECIEPNNPYNDGGGHDAGFNWAMENGGDCDGKSDSFNEGCEEYYRQLNKYNECIAKKNR